jgi:hypothetical protein
MQISPHKKKTLQMIPIQLHSGDVFFVAEECSTSPFLADHSGFSASQIKSDNWTG